MCPPSVLWWSLGLCLPFYHPDSTIVRRPQLWRSVSVCSSLHILTHAHCPQQRPNLFCRDSEIFVGSAWNVIHTHCHFNVALLPLRPVSYFLPVMCILFAPILFVLVLFRFRFIIVRKDFFPAEERNERFASVPLCDLHYMTQLCIVLASSSQFSFSCFDRLSNITTVTLSGPASPLPEK